MIIRYHLRKLFKLSSSSFHPNRATGSGCPQALVILELILMMVHKIQRPVGRALS